MYKTSNGVTETLLSETNASGTRFKTLKVKTGDVLRITTTGTSVYPFNAGLIMIVG